MEYQQTLAGRKPPPIVRRYFLLRRLLLTTVDGDIRYILRDLHKRTTAFFHNHGAS